MRYRNFIIREGKESKWEVRVPIRLEDTISSGFPIANAIGLFKTEEQAKLFIDSIHKEATE